MATSLTSRTRDQIDRPQKKNNRPRPPPGARFAESEAEPPRPSWNPRSRTPLLVPVLLVGADPGRLLRSEARLLG